MSQEMIQKPIILKKTQEEVMGLFKKIREADKALDNFVEGMIGNTISAVTNFAKARAYTVNLTLEDNIIGTLELVTSNIDYSMEKVNNYLASGVPLTGTVEDVLSFYRTLDRIEIGASRQLVRLDENKARSIIISLQERLRKQEAATTSSTPTSSSLGQTKYWDEINLGDSVSTALKKAKNGANLVEPGIYQLLGYNFMFDSRNIMVLNDRVEGLMAVKYFSCQKAGNLITEEMSSMLPFVKKTLFGNCSLALVKEYADNSRLTGENNFVEAIKQGELRYGFWPSDGSVSPYFQLLYDNDSPDKLMAMAAILSDTAVEAMT